MLTPYREGILDACEVLDVKERKRWTLEHLRGQLVSVGKRSDFHRARFESAGFDPASMNSLDDLRALPLMGKAEHQASLEDAPPLGTNLAVPTEDVVRVHFSSGTTGPPTPVAWTALDLERWADLYARGAYAFGVRHTDIYHSLVGFAWFVGGLGTHAGFERVGAMSIPGGNADSLRQLETIKRFGATFTVVTPSFAVHLARVAQENGMQTRDLPITGMVIVGEPGGSIPATRKLIEDMWDAKVYDAYGSLEFQPIAWECTARNGLHLFEDYAYAEVVDAATLEPLPDGEPGLLVLTHLDKQAHPFVRWSTGDVVAMERSVCECGRTTSRLVGGVRGRVDDMLVVRGINVFPSAVEEIVRAHPRCTGEYVIIVDDSVRDAETGHLNAIGVQVEIAPGDQDDASSAAEVGEELADQLKQRLSIRALIDPVAAGSLPATSHKSQRLIRR
ncbi:phenylacetate--CoA ligase family protein [Salinibacterium sp. ZJ450]|uniref:phenylacetate--CoA ligase family protein n=1 Tax=Salinibacterium sp. ZJ450 TaxID=2708338 RepID=UPI001421AD7F|nr:AMP-binding protein [Salinibacterium sp. ZJ450]